jgi:hypothetical protein
MFLPSRSAAGILVSLPELAGSPLASRDRGGGVDAGEREEEQRRPQADRRHGDVWDAGASIALQSVRRTGGVSSARPAVVNTHECSKKAVAVGRSISEVQVGGHAD